MDILAKISSIDATVIVALITLIGTVSGLLVNRGHKNKDLMLSANEQFMLMVEKLSNENTKISEEYAKKTKSLEEKIEALTKENTELRKEIQRMNSILIQLGINSRDKF